MGDVELGGHRRQSGVQASRRARLGVVRKHAPPRDRVALGSVCRLRAPRAPTSNFSSGWRRAVRRLELLRCVDHCFDRRADFNFSSDRFRPVRRLWF